MTDRISEIQAALDAVPAPPWRWIGSRTSGGPQLVTDHSGRQYLLRAAKPADAHGDEILDPATDYPVYGDLQFRDQRPGERYSIMRRGDELAIGRTHYDENNIVDVDNPIARFMRDAPQYIADLLAEVARLQGKYRPCGCPCGVLSAAFGDTAFATEDQARREFTPLKKDRERSIKQGFRLELVTFEHYRKNIDILASCGVCKPSKEAAA